MSLRPRRPPDGVGYTAPWFSQRDSVGSGLAGVSLGAATGAFCQVPDVKEWEDVDRRLTKIEGELQGKLAGYSSFQTEFKTLTVSFTQLLSRVGDVERKMQALAADVAAVKRTQEMHETTDMGRETRYQNLERMMQRLDGKLRAHAENQAMHAHDDGERWKPKGFQENDQPAEFMGVMR